MRERPPLVKICGLTRVEDALLAVELGADLLGLNFFAGSPRCVSRERARTIAAAVAGHVPVVGVFVNHPPAQVEEIAVEVGLQLLQFHGDERPEELAPFGGRAIKVLRSGGRVDIESLAAYPGVWGFLCDASHERLYGGTGESWEWRRVAGLAGRARSDLEPKRLLIAGGIGPQNVRQALAASRADGVDVGSAVESAPGVKDPVRLRELFLQVRAFEDRES